MEWLKARRELLAVEKELTRHHKVHPNLIHWNELDKGGHFAALERAFHTGAARLLPQGARRITGKWRRAMPNIRHEVVIGAPAEKVYGAITSQEGLSAWWTPDTKAKPERNSVARFAFGPNYFKEMKITDLEPARQVKWTCIHGADEWVGTAISFQLHPGDKQALLNSRPEATDQIQQQRNLDNGTLLIFSHDNWREHTPMFAECNYTWGQFLRSLKLLCETGKGRPWPQQHRSEP